MVSSATPARYAPWAARVLALAALCAPWQTSLASERQLVPSFEALSPLLRQKVLLGSPRSARQIADSPFGTHTTIMAEGAGAERMPQLVQAIAEAGYKWVEDYVSIGATDELALPAARQVWAGQLERAVRYAKLLHEQGIQLLVRIDSVRRKHFAQREQVKPAHLERAVVFTTEVLRRLSPYVQHYQVLNEPNLGNEKPEILPSAYVQVARAMAQVIRREQPKARIYGPASAMLQSLAPQPYPWVEAALGAGLLSTIDVFSFHPYRAPGELPEQASEFARLRKWGTYVRQIEALRKRLRDHAGREVPLASTEDGEPDFISSDGEQSLTWVAAAKHELRRSLLDFHLGISPRVRFCFYRNLDSAFYDAEGSYNTVTGDLQKKPLYYAAQNLHAVLDASYRRDDATRVELSSSGKGEEGPFGSYVQTYRKSHGEFDELLVFFWSSAQAEHRHRKTQATLSVAGEGWLAPVFIDMMTMPSTRSSEALTKQASAGSLRRGVSTPDAVWEGGKTHVRGLSLRDYPMLLKLVRPKLSAH